MKLLNCSFEISRATKYAASLVNTVRFANLVKQQLNCVCLRYDDNCVLCVLTNICAVFNPVSEIEKQTGGTSRFFLSTFYHHG